MRRFIQSILRTKASAKLDEQVKEELNIPDPSEEKVKALLKDEDALVKEKFKQIYTDKFDLYDLDKWETFEINNPRIFAGMYQFWCMKSKKIN